MGIFLAPKTRDMEVTLLQRQRLSDSDYAAKVTRENENPFIRADTIATPTFTASALSRTVQGSPRLPLNIPSTPSCDFSGSRSITSPAQRIDNGSALSGRWSSTWSSSPSPTSNIRSVDHGIRAANDTMASQMNIKTENAKRTISEVWFVLNQMESS